MISRSALETQEDIADEGRGLRRGLARFSATMSGRQQAQLGVQNLDQRAHGTRLPAANLREECRRVSKIGWHLSTLLGCRALDVCLVIPV
jgi:hypothetical protein